MDPSQNPNAGAGSNSNSSAGSSNDERVLLDVYRKIEREKALIQGAKSVRQSTKNVSVQQRCDTNIREAQNNINYLEETMRQLKLRRRQSAQEGDGTMPMSSSQRSMSLDPNAPNDGPPVPSKDEDKPRRQNFTRLDLIKYNTSFLGPRIQLMLQQLEFKLSVEKQYKEGIDKMLKLYQIEGDRRSKAEAEAKKKESAEKIQLLKKSLKRYSDMHIDIEEESEDNESLAQSNLRRPLTGNLYIACEAIKDVDHVATGRFAKSPESFITVKIEDSPRAKTKLSRNERWYDEFNIPVDKANEVEILVYDKSGGASENTPVGMMWLRISDIAEELRRKKVEQELNSAGWVSASKVQSDDTSHVQSRGHGHSHSQSNSSLTVPYSTMNQVGAVSTGHAQASVDPSQPMTIDTWFVLEPAGQIHLRLGFEKSNRGVKRMYDGVGGLGRQGAIRQKKEEVHEIHGHKFVQQQFYNIMRCALCGDFLKYSAGYHCLDCRYTCHKKCYPKVVTKCISKASTEADPDEEKLNHRIPHRFEPTTNMSANWCCHCGYILPLGKKNVRKCTECGLFCHTDCAHLVPDFCGMSMEMANSILRTIRDTKSRQQQQQQQPQPQPQQKKPLPKPGMPPSQSQQQLYQQDQNTQLPYGAANAVQSPVVPPPTPPPKHPPKRKEVGSASTTSASPESHPQQFNEYNQLQQHQQQQQQQYDQYEYQPQYQRPPQVPAHEQKPLALDSVDQYAPGGPTTSVSSTQLATEASQGTMSSVPSSAPPAAKKKPRRKIGLDDFNFLAVLGKGNFGKVMLAESKHETQQEKPLYAIKVLKKDFIIENDEVESTRSEKRVFLVANRERHPFLLNLHSCFQTENRVYFVMDYVSGGDLMWHIQKELFTPRRAQFYAAEVLLALKYFHDNGVIYRDLKLDNILLTLEGHVKIGDYGLCKEEMWYGKTTGTFCGTPEFMAPEILLEQKYGRAVDWWAFGVLIYQMLLGKSPFRGDDDDEVFDAILSDEPLYPIHMPRDSVSILQKLLTREPEKRLGSGPKDAEEIMAHPYFRNINFDDIYNCRVTPPFIPKITNATDVSNFDQEFTSEMPALTPVNTQLTAAMQEQFRGFSYLSGDAV